MTKLKTLLILTMLLIATKAWSFSGDTRLNAEDIKWYNSSNKEVTYLPASGWAYSQRFETGEDVGFYGLTMQLTTTYNAFKYGKLNVEYHVSNDGIHYISPTGASRIFTGISCQSMTFNNPVFLSHYGDTIYTPSNMITETRQGYLASAVIPIPPYKYFKIYIKETHGNREVTPTAKLSIQ